MNATLIFIMVAVAIGGVAWVFIFPLLSGERNAERRMANVARKEPMQQRSSRVTQKSRREQVEGTLKQLEARQKASKRVPLSMRLRQAGLSFTPRRFIVTCVSFGFGVFEKAYPDGRRTWLVARLPQNRDWTAVTPGSALLEFGSLEKAEDALRRWSIAPPAPKMVRKPRSAISGACRRNSNRPIALFEI